MLNLLLLCACCVIQFCLPSSRQPRRQAERGRESGGKRQRLLGMIANRFCPSKPKEPCCAIDEISALIIRLKWRRLCRMCAHCTLKLSHEGSVLIHGDKSHLIHLQTALMSRLQRRLPTLFGGLDRWSWIGRTRRKARHFFHQKVRHDSQVFIHFFCAVVD